jgi:diguanylate cyclase (GGDEF)-like protein
MDGRRIGIEMTHQTNIEHQPITDANAGKFQGSSLEFAQFCNDQFHAEGNYKGVLRRLVRILSDWFGLSEVIYLTLETNRGDGESRRNVMRFPPLAHIHEGVINSIRAALQAVVSGEDEICLGHHVIQVMGEDYMCSQFDESTSHRGVLVWKTNEMKGGSSFLDIDPQTLAPGDSPLEFLVRSAQQAAQWLRRLDSTQAMLYQDEVTGLYNYRYLDVAIDSEIRRLQRFHLPFSLLFIDLDNFKQVNDKFGHLTGSMILRQVGAEIKAAVRDVDSVIRYGGDEFVVVLLGANSRQAWQAAERVRSRVDKHEFKTESSGAKIRVTTSIGVACCPEHGRDKSTIVRLADETMYAAKNLGKNRVVMAQAAASTNQSSTSPRGVL